MKNTRSTFLHRFLIALVLAGSMPAQANPTGGQVAAGAASINTVPGTVTINQASNTAIINWQTFSIGSGELTKFVQPSSSSATLNRVLGGQTSIIDGTLSANGQIYLINGNGILVGPGGKVNTAGFLASTRDISNTDFLSGNLHFTGSNDNGVQNLGTINAIGGDVILIGKTVDNEGTINAPNGHAGLAAADDVLITQSGMEHVFVRSVTDPSSASGKTGVNNSGTINAASAELKAANGNIYALAVNNSGLVRATGVGQVDGHIWLVAEGNQGVTKNTGTLIARAKGGKGGTIETSGGQVIANGKVDAGSGGTWLIDPSDITIDAPTAATIDGTLNGGTSVVEDSSVGTGGSGNITVTAAMNWTTAATLTLSAYNNININASITGTSGTLIVQQSATHVAGTFGATAAINVGTFNLVSGNWVQNSATLPAFTAAKFAITSGASFLRVNGGSGVAGDPYQIADVYGLQGIGSSAANLSAAWFVSVGTINAASTSAWNAGAGFVPIGTTGSPFIGTFNGNGVTISGLTINLPAATGVGLFGDVGSAGLVEGTTLTTANITGKIDVGVLVGDNQGLVAGDDAAGTVTGVNNAASIDIGGLVGLNATGATVTSSLATTAVTGYSSVGGMVGENDGSLLSSNSSGNINSFHGAGAAGNSLGGLVGTNVNGTITLSFALGNVSASDSNDVGGLVGSSSGASALIGQSYSKATTIISGSTVVGLDNVGGLVGLNSAGSQIVASNVIDGTAVAHILGTFDVGGLVGDNSATVTQSFVLSTGNVLGQDRTTAPIASAQNIGGLIGENSSTVSSSYANVIVGQAAGTTDADQVGGLIGQNDAAGTVTSVYASGNVTGFNQVGGLVGFNQGSLGVQSNATGTVNGTTNVGGLIGSNTGAVGTQSYTQGNVTGVNDVGGLIGLNNATGQSFVITYTSGNVTGTTYVGGLIGWNKAGTVTSSHASGNISDNNAANSQNLGGLIGENDGAITTSFASGSVTGNTTTSLDVGGLVGDNTGSVGTQSSATGNVTGHQNVGGLLGQNSGTVGDSTATVEALASYTDATGNVTGTLNVGGLIGDNSGTAQQVTATGPVKGAATASGIGGLIGTNETAGTVVESFSTSTVYGNGTGTVNGADTDVMIGGLIGDNKGAVTKTYATGVVVGDGSTGGLIGYNQSGAAKVQTSYSIGTVTGITQVGGLVGWNFSGTIYQNYSTETVVGTTSVGGLVGENDATIMENYSTGSASGTTNVGGLVGLNSAAGLTEESYATGVTTGVTANTFGGLVGVNNHIAGGIVGSYWDGTTTTQGVKGVGNDPTNTGATELTSATAFTVGSYTGFGTSSSVATGSSITDEITDAASNVAWYILNGSTRPYLAWEAPINTQQVGGAYVIYTSHQLQLMAVNLGASYVLGQAINLSDVQVSGGLWNPAVGFVPIGDGTKAFSGSFAGGFGISNLFINTAASDVGLFGASSGALSNVTLTGVNVTGGSNVGSVVGLNTGSLNNASAIGTVTGVTNVGGLVGENEKTLADFDDNVVVTGQTAVGGLVGFNFTSSTIQDGYAIGNVSGNTEVGGLVGDNEGSIKTTYATGNVTGAGAAKSDIGGLVGTNAGGSVNQSYAVGAVSGTTDVGGLVGFNSLASTIVQSYATGKNVVGTVSGTTDVGGLVGENDATSSVKESYANSTVTGTTDSGGLIGKNDAGGVFSNLYWDTSNDGFAVGNNGTVNPAGVTNLHGLTIDSSTATYAGLDSNGTGFTTGADGSLLVYGSSDSVWRIQKGVEFPFLTSLSTQVSGTDYSDPTHLTASGGTTVTFNSGSNQLSTTTSSSTAGSVGSYNFLFSADNALFNYLPSVGPTLRISDATHSGDAIAATLYNNNGVPNLLADIAPADLWGKTVRVVSSGLDNSLLAGAGSAFITTPTTNPFGGTNIEISENFDVANVAGSYTFNGDITAQGNITFDSPSSVASTFDHPVTINAVTSAAVPIPSVTLNAPLSSQADNRALVVESDGDFVNNVGTGAFSTPNGTFTVYSQNPEGSGQSYEDDNGGLNELHLYGTNYTLTPTYLLAPNQSYQIYTFTPTLTLTAVANGSTAGTLSVVYGTASPGLMYTTSGLLPGDTVTAGATFNQVLSQQPSEMTTYAKYSPVGTYPVNFIPSTEPTSLIGYKLVFASGNIVVTQSQTTVDLFVSGSQTFAYINGGTPTYSYTDTGAVMGDPNFNPTFTTSVGQYTNVLHSGATVVPYMGTITVNTASLGNYASVTVVTDQGFTVNPAPLAVTTTAGTSVYGSVPSFAGLAVSGNNPSGTGTIYDNSGTGATVTLTSQGYSFTNPGVTSASHVNTYTIPVSGPTGNASSGILGNYNVTVTNGTYTITPAPLTVTANNQSKTYGGADPTLTYTPSGTLYNGDTYGVISGVVLATTTGAAATAGTHPITATGGTASDYTITDVNGTLTVTQAAAITIAANNQSKVYGAADPTLTYSLASGTLFYGDTVTTAVTGVTLATTTGAAATVGTHTITATGGTSANYVFNPATDGNGTLTVTPATLTITAKPQTHVYGTAFVLTGAPAQFTAVGLAYGQTIGSTTLTSTGAAATSAVAGSPYPIVISAATGGTFTPSNYNISYVNGAMTVTPAPLTLTANNQTKQYGTLFTFAGTEFTPTGLKNGETVGSVTLTSGATPVTAHVAGSPYSIVISAATGGTFTASNYNITYTNGKFTVTKAPLTVTANNQSKVYGAVDPTLTDTPSGTLYNGDTYAGVISGVVLATTTGAAATAGTHPITATGGTANDYSITDVNGLLTVSQAAAITIAATNQSKVYGAADPTLTYGLASGTLYYGDTAMTAVTGVTLGTTTGAAATVGTHTITATGGTSLNYIFNPATDGNGTLTVTPATLTITADNQTHQYGTAFTLTGAPAQFNSAGLAYGETVGSVTLTSTGAAATSAVVGSPYAIVPSAATGGTFTASNYNISYVNGAMTVTPAPLTVTANNEAKTYGQTFVFNGSTEFTDSALQNGETIGSVTLTSTGTPGTAAVSGSPYAIVASAATGGTFTASNYAITYVNGALTVSPAPLTITANSTSKTFGTALVLPGTAFTDSALQNGETISSVTLTSAGTPATANVSGSPYSITASNPIGGGTFNANNYTITYVPGTLTVNTAALSITADNQTHQYGTAFLLTGLPTQFSSVGLQNGNTIGSVTLTSTGAAATSPVAGSPYTIVPSAATGGTFIASNYTITYNNGTMTVTKAPLIITADNQTHQYGTAFVLTGAPAQFNSVGLQNGETIGSTTLTSTGAAATSPVVGSPYSIVPSAATGGTFTANNYSITYNNGTMTVTPAPLTITANSTSKTYGQTVTFTGTEFTDSALQNGETVGSVTLTSTGTPGTAAVSGSPYAIVASSATGGTFTASNYAITYVNGGLTVNPAPLTITANSTSKTFGTALVLPGTAFTDSALQNGETISSVTLTSAGTPATANVSGSPYSITASNPTGGGTFNANNYTITYVPGTLTVNTAALSITADNQTHQYGTAFVLTGAPAQFNAVGLQNGNTIGSVTLTSTGAAATSPVVGSPYTIVPSAATGGTFIASNYTITYNNGTMTVTPAPLTITANSTSKTFGQTVTFAGTEFTSSPLQNGETIGSATLSSPGAVNTAAVVGSPYGITVSAATGGTFTPSNYAITYVPGSLTVNAAALVITADNQTHQYGTAFVLTGAPTQFNSVGLQNGNTIGSVTLTSTGAAATSPVAGSPYSIVPSAATGGTFIASNYSITYNNGTMTVTQAPLTITANSTSKTFGQTVTFAGTEFTDTPLQNGETISSVTLTSAGAPPTANVSGSPYSITASNPTGGGTFNANNYTITYVPGTLTVNTAALSITADNQTHQYGTAFVLTGAPAQFNAVGLQNGNTIGSVTLTSTGAAATSPVVGSPYTIVPSAATGGTFIASNYTITYNNGTMTVTPAPLTITANSTSKTFGQTVTFAGTEFTSSPLQNGETIGSATLSSPGAVNTAAVVGSPYGITVSAATGGTFTASNYAITYVPGTLTVNAAALVITADNQTHQYGTAFLLTGLPTQFSSVGLQNGNTIGSVTLTSTGAAATSPVAGSPYSIVPSAATGGTFIASNYSITYNNGTMTVTQAPLTITANSTSKTFGQTVTFAGTEFTDTPLQNGETISSVTLTSAGAPPTANVSGSPYSITASNPTGGGTFNPNNYAITYVPGTLTVNTAALTITANDQTKTYGTTFTFAGTEFGSTGLQNGDTIGSATLASAGSPGIAPVAGSPYGITVGSATGGTFIPGNYAITYVPGTMTVTQAPLTITADSTSKSYGQTVTFAGTEFTDTPLQNGETISSVTLTSAGAPPTADVAGSPYGIAASNPTGGGTFSANNYAITYVPGTLTVTPAALNITANDQTKTYGQTITFTGTEFGSTGLQNGESIGSATLTSAGAPGTATVAGSPYSIGIGSATGGTFNPANYAVTYTPGALTIDPALLTITANPETKLYGTTFTFLGTEFTDTGLVNGDTLTQVTLTSLGTPAPATPGNYPIALTPNSEIGSGLANYTITFKSAPFMVVPIIIGQPSVAGTSRADFDQFEATPYADIYGERRFYELEVPGTIHRVVPENLSGIENGSSTVDTRIGMETVYRVDRFQTFRH